MEETREGDDKEELPRPTTVGWEIGTWEATAAVGCKEGGRERDGRLGLRRRRLLQVARREGKGVLGLGENRDLYSKTKMTLFWFQPKRRRFNKVIYNYKN